MENTINNNHSLSPKENSISRNKDDQINNKLAEIALRTEKYYQMPPIIGMVIADQYGNTILVVEYENDKRNNYGPIKSYLSEDDKSLLELDLISMFFSSLKVFASQANIKNLSNFQIHGSNIKIQIYFILNKFMLILFLNSNTELKARKQTIIIDYFKDNLAEFEYEFENFNLTESKKILKLVERKAIIILKKLNKQYLQEYNKNYSKKHELLEKIQLDITPIIQKELDEYLEYVPNDVKENLTKELNGKIQDMLFNLKNDLFKF